MQSLPPLRRHARAHAAHPENAPHAPALRRQRGTSLAWIAALAFAGIASCSLRGGEVATGAPLPVAASSGTPRGAASKSPSVACGGRACTPGEKCCVGIEDTSCVPDDGTRYCPDRAAQFTAMTCDEADDCATGQACCAEYTAEGTKAFYCGEPPCSHHEACRPGGRCQPGLRCQAESGDEAGGRCVVSEPRARCGGFSCEGDAPECCYSHAAELATCVAAGACDRDAAFAFQCSSRADCAGYFCCREPGGYACAGRCDSGSALCVTVDDCPPSRGREATGCSAAADGRSGVRACVYPG